MKNVFVKIWMLLYEIISECFFEIFEWLKDNLYNIATVINAFCPYITSYAVIGMYIKRGRFVVGSEWMLPVACWFLVACLKRAANKIGKGVTVPVPRKRFTDKSDDGEITIQMERSEELVLYMCELEDWLEKRDMI